MQARLLLTAALLAVATPALAQQSPEAFVKGLYVHYRESGNGIRRSGALAARTFHPSLLALFERDRKAAKGEVGAIGADPICDCQDYDIRSVEPTALPERNGIVPVKVRIRNFGETNEVELRLKRVPDGWRIYDTATKEVPSLRAMIEAHLKQFPG